MLQPIELRSDLPMKLSNNVVSTTTKVWNILVACKRGDLEAVKRMADGCHELLYAQYNYTPPIHFAVREGHIELVKYLLANGAHDPAYKIYPFQESLQTIANDRGYYDIESLLNEYAANSSLKNIKVTMAKFCITELSYKLNLNRLLIKMDLKKLKPF